MGGMAPQVFALPLHMGSLHPYEQALTLLLAFGPFVLLGIVVAVRRHADGSGRDETAESVQSGQSGQSGEGAEPESDRASGAESSPGQPAR